MQLFFSNELDVLFNCFEEWLSHAMRDPFAPRLVIVPHSALKTWLQLRLATSKMGIAAGIQILTVDSAFRHLSAHPEYSVPSRLELSIAIGVLLQEKPLTHPAHQLLGGNTGHRRRLLAMSDELAILFDNYGRYGSAVTAQWQNSFGWQEQLYQEIYERWPHWQPLSKQLSHVAPTENLSIALFGIPYLIPVYHQVLHKLDGSVAAFVPSPCQHFWSDILTPREGKNYRKLMKSYGVSEGQQDTLDGLLEDTNPLLSSLGRAGRLMAIQLESSDIDIESLYTLPKAISELPYYSELVLPDIYLKDRRKTTLLQYIQADLSLLRSPVQGQHVGVVADDSIQVHVSHSRIREVEALYNTLLGIIHRHSQADDPIYPSDIIVMAPNIDLYRTLIDAVFGAGQSQIPYRIAGGSWREQSSYIDAIMTLLDISASRWDIVNILNVFNGPHSQKKHQLTTKQLHRVRELMQLWGVTWGKNLLHRNDLLKKAHCSKGMQEDGFIGTWDYALGMLIEALVSDSSSVDFGDADVIAEWISLLESLWTDLQPIMDGSPESLSHWTSYLKCLCDGYFVPSDSSSKEDRERLFLVFDQLQHLAKQHPDAPFDFQTVHHYLLSEINAARAISQENRLQTVRFQDIVLPTEPVRIIVFVGMDDGAFPRPHALHALDLLRNNPLADEIPKDSDTDRYAFLLAMQGVRDYLILSYCGLSTRDGKEQGPALVVSELLSYLNRFYLMGDCSAGNAITIHHPYYPFDESYFALNSPLQGYRDSHYRAALARLNLVGRPNQGFLVAGSANQVHPKELIIDVNDLLKAAKNPLKLYLKNYLDLRIRNFDDNMLSGDERFSVNALDAYGVYKASLECSPTKACERLKAAGKLPLGLFGEASQRKLLDEMAAYHLPSHNIFTVELATDCKNPHQISDSVWRHPPIQLQLEIGSEVKLVGKISNLSEKGLLIIGNDKPNYRVRGWPSSLLLAFLQLDIQKRVVFIKDGGAFAAPCDALPHLQSFVEYYLLARECPSPLIEEWVPQFIEKPIDSLKKTLVKDCSDDEHFHNIEAKWLLREDCDCFDDQSLEHWKQVAFHIYGDVLDKEKS